ncbi:MAG: hypothetical protein KJT03_21170, partial [Verrucomicrobiae bacterium]|nr:hypothetical protein [Verrucomicrobiae bacterium]
DNPMTDTNKVRLIIFSGSSCVGKSPLVKARARFYPELCERELGCLLLPTRVCLGGCCLVERGDLVGRRALGGKTASLKSGR